MGPVCWACLGDRAPVCNSRYVQVLGPLLLDVLCGSSWGGGKVGVAIRNGLRWSEREKEKAGPACSVPSICYAA